MNPYIESIRPVWENPLYISVNERKLKSVAKKFAKEDFKVPNWRFPVFYQEDSTEFIDFLGVGNAINFCFRDLKTKQRFATEYNGECWEGAFGMFVCLKRALEEGMPVLSTDFLAKLNSDTVKHIFRGDPPLPMMEERFKLLKATGLSLDRKYGSFSKLFEESSFRAFDNGCGIVERLANDFCSYYDTNSHQPTRSYLHFHKRANLLVLMYQGRALDSNGALPPIENVAELTPPADYEVPKALKYLGILKYAKRLEKDILEQKPIPKNSVYEVEIRAQTVNAMLRLVEEINELRDNPITIVELDYKLWSEGRNSPEPHHLTETTAY